ncbi:MAG: sugar phosphate nucleotidyltransferase, partial [Gammaproteobacteria bacterium]|nr:sugar phosphate nucleotidyltransferase [Gammaproteobacteria bacterium]
MNKTTTKGILLLGGSGSRFYPVTLGVNKHLLPVYDRPSLYFPLSLLMHLGIQNILIITSPEHLGAIEKVLGTGEQWGVTFTYTAQPIPLGIAHG